EIFATHGEGYFRDLETAVLRDALKQPAVIATGGGIVLRKENRALLQAHTPVIWLKASPKFLAGRIAGDSNRPLIAGGDPLPMLKRLAKERYPLYKVCANHVVARGKMKKCGVVKSILAML
ncbi:MAG: shikimate kinase, partial [Mariprofundales bacterium]